ncbi:methionyl-tRNA formyltransferase [Microbacterium nymphoidis]|uniref:methionyl-tRNA formyltransferase n=1 Tax=Microbacterium nymphoidis TaxID=2898586 RepID=UPI001E5ECE95|nr:methionyl-tRNA formyltransferase [Microbacterium nymphoidis]MCD2497419.1 methionyl-tRNA formyltransferase [Microbacterium nymphoidis]
MRIVFAGTPEAAVPSLRALAASDHEVVLVVTRPDAPLGRKRVLTPSPVAAAADELGLPVLKAARLDAEATAAILATEADLGVIVAYGALVREPLLTGLGAGWVNLHFSLLPKWRGAAPVQRALIAGDSDLGWAVFQLVAELDAGAVYRQESYTPEPAATAADVLAALAEIGGAALPDIVTRIGAGATPVDQVGEPSYAHKLTLSDGLLDPAAGSAAVLARYRGVTPEPGAHVRIEGATLKTSQLAIADTDAAVPAGVIRMEAKQVLLGTADRPVRLVRVQPAGKQAMAAGDWWRGLRVDQLSIDPLPAAPEPPTEGITR